MEFNYFNNHFTTIMQGSFTLQGCKHLTQIATTLRQLYHNLTKLQQVATTYRPYDEDFYVEKNGTKIHLIPLDAEFSAE